MSRAGVTLEISLSKSEAKGTHAPEAGEVSVLHAIPEAPLVVASTQTDL